MELLRKKDLHPLVGVPKSTAADWIEDFHVFIPKVKKGNVIYYKPETIDVLKFIKKCREQNYQKVQIMEMLSEKGFPITVEDAVEDVKNALQGDTPRDTLLTVMQTMGQAVKQLAEQDERMNLQGKAIEEIQERQDEQDGRIDELTEKTREIEMLKQELSSLKNELATVKEEKNKGFFARLFGK